MHNFAFIVRACDDETAQTAAEHLLSAVVCIRNGNEYVAHNQVGHAEIFTTMFEEGRAIIERIDPLHTTTCPSVFDPYYSTLHNCNRGIGMDVAINLQKAEVYEDAHLPAMRRVACVLNYMCMFAGTVYTGFPCMFELRHISLRLCELMASGQVQVSLRPSVIHPVLTYASDPMQFPWFNMFTQVESVTLGNDKVQVPLGFAHPVLFLNVALLVDEELMLGQRMPTVTNIVFRGNADDALTFTREDENLLRWGNSDIGVSVLMPITDAPIWDKARMFEEMFIRRTSINFSKLEHVTLIVDIENPDMLPCKMHITSFSSNVLRRHHDYFWLVFPCC